MSILKGIMHHWNKTKNDYDVIHPETDYKKITDWNEGIVATLASTALGTLVSTLTSDSLLATMIQKVLTATGVRYNVAQNGYLCFGSLFGGLIIQWGRDSFGTTNQYKRISYPISMTLLALIPYDIIGLPNNGAWTLSLQTEYSTTSAVITTNTKNTVGAFGWVGIGYQTVGSGQQPDLH